MPVAFQGGSLGRRNPFIGLGTETSASTSTSTSTTSSAASGSKPTTRLPSRPLSGATTATDTTAKPRRAKTPQPTRPQAITSEHHVHLQTEVLGAASSSSTKKAKKTNIFSVAIANPKPRSTGLANGTSSPTPDDQRSRGLFSGFRSGSRSGSQSSVGSSRSNVIERTSPRNTPPPPVPKLNADTSKRTRISLSTPLSPTVPVHVLNSPPPPYRQNDYARGRDDVEPDDLDLGGRCSPLCGLQSAMAPTAGPSEKGKERERARGARDRSRETNDERERRRRQEKDITHPRRVGSPILREREREARAALVAPAPLEKVASGSGSGTSRRSSTKESVTNAIKTKRTKHGSFDFERPVSALGGGNIRTVLGMGLGADSYDRARTQPMERSVSVKEKVPRAQELGVTQGHKMTSSLPSSVGRTRRPVLDVDTAPAITRHATESSQATSAPASSATRSHHHHADMDPISPTSSHSGHSSSLGRHTGGRLLRGMHGAFRFEPAVPPIPGSPATDERSHLSGRAAGTSASPTKLRQGRVASKGRSLDLGLSLSWAPQKVKQEAVLSYGRQTSSTTGSTGRSRARWGGAMVDDQGRLGAGSSQASSDVAQAFREALGDAAYGTFKNCK
ncbi:hypothetical protein PHLCEN_2v1581 [Hermanssonia centrifuga]|uniref:Uncharacterized protein n=1 Tax=Hermanssonia centrifuga TaxID=98765 RepID=A0A2R6RZI4_9APHY|nr:hypothetical protein PHLCEN_2v1581 [Hermanssonia centrifuga]